MSNITIIYNKFIYIKALTGMQEFMHHMAIILAYYNTSRNNTKIFDPDKMSTYLGNLRVTVFAQYYIFT